MLVISSSKADNNPQAQQRQLEASISASSPFSPKTWLCPLCHSANTPETRHCTRSGCGRLADRTTTFLDQKNRPVSPLRFPVHWICSTCYLIHSVLAIITGSPSCACGRPSLQAIYDQFGDLFLFWRDDPTVRDLRDPGQVEEAARRLWVTGGDRWLEEMPKIMLEREEERRAEDAEMPML
jgi:hypothetical protein